ncbi:MAG: Fis family transcriptional regulator [Fibrobacterota bacterium]
MNTKNKHIGSRFDDFLSKEGILEETEASAIKRVVAYQIEKAMKGRHLTKTQMAIRMRTSRSALDRLFDPENESVTLLTLNRAAVAVGRKLKVELV